MAKGIQKLIDGQTIRIDGHVRGVPNVWNENHDIHLHKTTHHNGEEYELRISLNHPQCEQADLPNKIRKEIKSAVKDNQHMNIFYESVYKYLQSNFKWDRNDEDERKIIKNIERAFGINSKAATITTNRGMSSQKNAIQMMVAPESMATYHVSLNYAQRSVYIGQFLPFVTSGISKEAQSDWARTIENKLELILTSDNPREELSALAARVSGVDKKVIQSTFDFLMRMYGEVRNNNE